ncbi:CBS domain-containing protein [Rhodohalobacter sulfatireducens]|uniref:CBS domain-containing protein n=1 Tax=Rhodohalobacter sulfatireducens TaxID=2911366 RepID=A0ABS9KC04_9BACT|nr:CBS domain-containing protein [Rhodohalobacter sulfatireducens]MDR9364248.1 CBS domain-containing protein [Balneolaceae bacterium]MDR9408977.1 CBS domain-containing protein [Balneolaceae bacterium]
MLAKDLLNTDFKPLEPSSTISAALAKMDAWQTSNIPIVEPTTKKNIGHILFDDISDITDEQQTISSLELRQPVYALKEQHVFEVARQMLQHEVRLLPVVDSSETYLGVIEKKQVLEALSTMLNIATAGSTITVEIPQSDFTISELVHLIETEGAKILGLTVEQPVDFEESLRVSLKISHEDTSAVISSLQRHGYITTTANRNDQMQVDLSTRADELLRYLDV